MTTLGKLWTGAVAYVSLIVGAGLSIAGNLADTYRVRGAATDRLDEVLAAGWPVLVLLAVHMFVSPRWSAALMFQVWRWAGVLSIGGMAMLVSWTHLHALLLSRGQMDIVAVLGPLAIDGMAIMATGLILSTRTRGHEDTPGQDSEDRTEDNWTPYEPLRADSPNGQGHLSNGLTAVPPDLSRTGSGQGSEDNWTGHEGDSPTGVLSRTDAQWTGQDMSIADEATEFLSRLSSAPDTVQDIEPLESPAALPARTRPGQLTPDQRTEVFRLMAEGRARGAYSVADLRTLLAAWYGVSTKTIQRTEGR